MRGRDGLDGYRRIKIICILGVVIAYLPFVFFYDKVLAYDWDYFNALALFMRSAILNYHTLPLQDPWVCGGMDVLSNPQNWIFSPFLLLTLLFSPYFANALSLLLLSFCGLWGASKFFEHYGIDKKIAWATALLFVNSAWIGLHFVEGHIVYRTFLLFPYLIYILLTLNHKKNFLILCFLCALILLDGGMYTFIFFAYLSLLLLIIDKRVRTNLLAYMRFHPWECAVGITAFFMLSAIKIVPVLLSQSLVQTKAVLDFYPLNLKHIISIFFSMFKTNNDYVPIYGWRYHEFGCYVGPIIVSTVVYGFFKYKYKILLKEYWKEITLLFLFFIIASGIGGAWNPWHLMQKLPFINKAHMQSRYFLIFFIYLLVLFAVILQKMEDKKRWAMAILLLVNLEFLISRYVILFDGFNNDAHSERFDRLIISKSVTTTHHDINKLQIYYLPNRASKECYDPAKPKTSVIAAENSTYRGEAYALNAKGSVEILRYTPGHLEINYQLAQLDTLIVNTNLNRGWQLVSGPGELLRSDESNLLKIRVHDLQGSLHLKYVPKYFTLLLLLYGSGLLLFIGLLVRRKEINGK
ncbi:MAG: hypothetical protein HQK50_09470 [Oligoflexia bacterium]|nr:hypothetical protein [Oligoflexia bacterium]